MADPLHVACPECGTLNRVPAARLGQGGRCGACHEPLFAGRPMTLNAGNFARQAIESDLPLLVDFWAPWCGPCRTMAPTFEAAAAELEPSVRFGKLDTDDEPEIAGRFHIHSIPTLVLLHRGRELGRTSGIVTLRHLIAWVRQHVATPA